jgi:hypothetical protein
MFYTAAMQKTMEAVTVTTNDDSVIIEQDSGPEDCQSITLSPDQIPLLIEWLEEARKSFTPS